MYALNQACVDFAQKLIAKGVWSGGWMIPAADVQPDAYLGVSGSERAYPVIRLDEAGEPSVSMQSLREIRHLAGMAGETDIYRAACDLLMLGNGAMLSAEEQDGFWADLCMEGTWVSSNGTEVTLTRSDIKAMVKARKETPLNPPLRAGDHKDSILKPAFGWVADLELRDDANGKAHLFGYLTDVPDVVQDAFRKKLYRTVSAGLWQDWTFENRTYPWVLNHVAILGATLPAVVGLEDLGTYLSSDANGAQAFVLTCHIEQEHDVKELQELQARVTALEAEGKTKDATIATQQKQIAEFEKSAARSEVSAAIDAANKDAVRVAPADREKELSIGLALRADTNFASEDSPYKAWAEGLKKRPPVIDLSEKGHLGEQDTASAEGKAALLSDYEKKSKELAARSGKE